MDSKPSPVRNKAARKDPPINQSDHDLNPVFKLYGRIWQFYSNTHQLVNIAGYEGGFPASYIHYYPETDTFVLFSGEQFMLEITKRSYPKLYQLCIDHRRNFGNRDTIDLKLEPGLCKKSSLHDFRARKVRNEKLPGKRKIVF